MTTLSPARYMGSHTFTAEDSAGNIFYAYQAAGSDAGVLVMVTPDGRAQNVTPVAVIGRPCLECIPHVGLWFVGNKESGATQPPPRHRVSQYVPWETARQSPIVIAPTSPIGVLWSGAYTAADFDTPAEVALRVGKLLHAVNQVIDVLIDAGVVVRG